MCLFLKMVLRPWNAFLAWAILILISLIDLPSLVMWDPRYFNVSSCCNIVFKPYIALWCFLFLGDDHGDCFLVQSQAHCLTLLLYDVKQMLQAFSDVAIRANVISISEAVDGVASDSNAWKITNLPHDAFAAEREQVR